MPEHLRPSPPFKQHLHGAAGLSLLIVLYLLPGSVGHDPWRGDDVRHFAAVFSLLNGESLLLPSIAGEPLTQFAPLYHWVGAVFALALGWLLPVHDAARLASPFFAGLAIFWIARAASRLYGKQTRTAAALLTLGTLGLAVHAHEHQPMIALIAMQAWTLAGLALVPTQPVRGSLQAALGVALAFLSGGFAGLLLTLPLFLVLAIGCPDCRTPRASGALILGLSLGLMASAIWPIMLNHHAPDLFDQWWDGSLMWVTAPLAGEDAPKLLELLGWFAWPLWPLALWALWRARRQIMRLPFLLPLTALVLFVAWLYVSGETRAAAMLPIIPPLALLAASGIPSLRRGAANAFDWFAITTFAVFALLIWLAWTAQVFLWPPGLGRSLARMAPDFVLHGTLVQAGLGLFITLTWMLLVWHVPRSLNRGPTNWAMGMTMLWCLAVSLLLPWFDHSRNYRPVSESLSIALAGETPGCVASLGLSHDHRAAFDYFSHLRVTEVAKNETACPFLLVHDEQRPPRVQPDAQWQNIWEFQHAGGKRLEIFRLYRRE